MPPIPAPNLALRPPPRAPADPSIRPDTTSIREWGAGVAVCRRSRLPAEAASRFLEAVISGAVPVIDPVTGLPSGSVESVPLDTRISVAQHVIEHAMPQAFEYKSADPAPSHTTVNILNARDLATLPAEELESRLAEIEARLLTPPPLLDPPPAPLPDAFLRPTPIHDTAPAPLTSEQLNASPVLSAPTHPGLS